MDSGYIKSNTFLLSYDTHIDEWDLLSNFMTVWHWKGC